MRQLGTCLGCYVYSLRFCPRLMILISSFLSLWGCLSTWVLSIDSRVRRGPCEWTASCMYRFCWKLSESPLWVAPKTYTFDLAFLLISLDIHLLRLSMLCWLVRLSTWCVLLLFVIRNLPDLSLRFFDQFFQKVCEPFLKIYSVSMWWKRANNFCFHFWLYKDADCAFSAPTGLARFAICFGHD